MLRSKHSHRKWCWVTVWFILDTLANCLNLWVRLLSCHVLVFWFWKISKRAGCGSVVESLSGCVRPRFDPQHCWESPAWGGTVCLPLGGDYRAGIDRQEQHMELSPMKVCSHQPPSQLHVSLSKTRLLNRLPILVFCVWMLASERVGKGWGSLLHSCAVSPGWLIFIGTSLASVCRTQLVLCGECWWITGWKGGLLTSTWPKVKWT